MCLQQCIPSECHTNLILIVCPWFLIEVGGELITDTLRKLAEPIKDTEKVQSLDWMAQVTAAEATITALRSKLSGKSGWKMPHFRWGEWWSDWVVLEARLRAHTSKLNRYIQSIRSSAQAQKLQVNELNKKFTTPATRCPCLSGALGSPCPWPRWRRNA